MHMDVTQSVDVAGGTNKILITCHAAVCVAVPLFVHKFRLNIARLKRVNIFIIFFIMISCELTQSNKRGNRRNVAGNVA